VSVSFGPEDDEKSQQPPEAGLWHFSFDTTGGTHRITQSIETLWRGERSQSNPAPDLRGAVNYDGGKVQGVDIPVHAYVEKIHERIPFAQLFGFG
jgi:hypothetical protein